MIEYIKGKLTELNPAYAVLEAAGVGYEINISLTTYSALMDRYTPDKPDNDAEVKLLVTEIIREDAHLLFGFFTKGERNIFLLLNTVSGIGANTARMIMSAYPAAELRQVIATGNARALGQIKGLGPKTAQRIIVDLKDKILKIDVAGEENGKSKTENGMWSADSENPIKTEAVSALTMLGFAAAASAKAVDKILTGNPSAGVEEVIKQALKML